MAYKAALILHMLGAAVWIGGHAVLVLGILPGALRDRDHLRIVEFERAYGRVGLGALAIQLTTGLWLANTWIGGDWRGLLGSESAAAHIVLLKLFLLAATLAVGGHAYHRVLPRLSPERLGVFAVHAWLATLLSVMMLIAGASVRLGGPF